MSARKYIALATDGALRLARICGMFGSHHDGERASAALKADTFVREAGLTWRQVITRTTPSIERKIKFCLKHSKDCCTEWEEQFLWSIAGLDELSEKQEAVLDRIHRKTEIHVGMKR